MTKEQKRASEAAIVADLANPRLTYLHIAYTHKVGYATVVAVSKKHSLTRTRGRKKSNPLSVVEG
jgi:hypothetical protein